MRRALVALSAILLLPGCGGASGAPASTPSAAETSGGAGTPEQKQSAIAVVDERFGKCIASAGYSRSDPEADIAPLLATVSYPKFADPDVKLIFNVVVDSSGQALTATVGSQGTKTAMTAEGC